MAVECINSSVYVSKILSERRKVRFYFLLHHLIADSTFFKLDIRIYFKTRYVKLKLFSPGKETADGKNAPGKNQRQLE